MAAQERGWKERLPVFWVTGLLIMILDQWTKGLIIEKLPLYGVVPVITGFFNIVHVRNTGAAFSLLASLDARFFFIAFSVIAVAVLHLVVVRAKHLVIVDAFALGLILGGASGNLLDRVRLGSVVDFLDFSVGRFHWPAFNVADTAISLGAAVFILRLSLFADRPSERQGNRRTGGKSEG